MVKPLRIQLDQFYQCVSSVAICLQSAMAAGIAIFAARILPGVASVSRYLGLPVVDSEMFRRDCLNPRAACPLLAIALEETAGAAGRAAKTD